MHPLQLDKIVSVCHIASLVITRIPIYSDLAVSLPLGSTGVLLFQSPFTVSSLHCRWEGPRVATKSHGPTPSQGQEEEGAAWPVRLGLDGNRYTT